MRMLILAGAAALGLAGAATAQVWSDPGGLLTFDNPRGWAASLEDQPNMTYVVTGTANNECHLLAIPRPETAGISARDAHRAGANAAAFTPEAWARSAGGITTVFRGGVAQVLSQSAETEGRFWPIQRAEIQGPSRLVHVAIQIRPGIEFMTLCQTYEGAEPLALYDAVIRSVAHPNDAVWQAEAEQAQRERDAQTAPPPPAQ